MPHLGLQRVMVPGSQVSSLTTGNITLAGAKSAFDVGPYSAFEPLAVVTVGSGGAATVEFSGISRNYRNIQIRGIARGTNASANLDIWMRYNSDSISGNYYWHRLFGDGATIYAQWNTNPVAQMYVGHMPGASATADIFGACVIDISDYDVNSKTRTLRSHFGYDASGSGITGMASASWSQSSYPVSSITLLPQSGSFAEFTTFALFGVK